MCSHDEIAPQRQGQCCTQGKRPAQGKQHCADDGDGQGQGHIRAQRLRGPRLDLRGRDDRADDQRYQAPATERPHLPHAAHQFQALPFAVDWYFEAPANGDGPPDFAKDD
jgi:hypothetical protein